MNNQNVLIGISGGIAAYKTLTLISLLKEQGADVRVVLTESAKQFVTPLTCQALTGHPAYDDLWYSHCSKGMDHIQLAKWANHIIIAPATANIIAKVAYGLADDLLSTTILASNALLTIAPAMNQQMWHNSATQTNIRLLKSRNIQILGPAEGKQACGDMGLGRMLEAEDIFNELFSAPRPLKDMHILITAGPTQEAIDPVRYITNHSSGKMGYALAAAAVSAGAKVTLVSGPVQLQAPANIELIKVKSALEMQHAVEQYHAHIDIFIAAAAVSDYRSETINTQKIEKSATNLSLSLTRNPDILATVAARHQIPYIVGFAAQTHDIQAKALAKLECKQIDMIIANDVSGSDIGFQSDDNAVQVYWKKDKKDFPKMKKTQLAKQLIQLISEQFYAKHPSKNS